MPVWDNLDVELDMLRNFHERRRAADDLVAQVDEEAAYRATLIHDAYSFLPPGASIALAASGIGPDSDLVHRVASTYLKAQNAASVAPYGSTIRSGDMQPSASDQSFKKYGVARDAAGSSGGGVSWRGALGAVKDAATSSWDDPMSKVRGVTRAADLAGRFAPQMVQARYREQRKAVQDKGLMQTFRDNLTSPTQWGKTIASTALQTDLGAAETQLLTQGKVDTGSGFFLNDEKGVGQIRRQSETAYSPTITYADGSKHIVTIGRDIAGGVGLEPGSRGYSLVSGLGDAAVVIATAKATGAAGQERRAAKAFKTVAATEDGASWVRNARASAGALWSPGKRLTYDPELARSWMDGPRGTEVVEWLKGATSTRTIDAVTGGKLDPQLLRRLADATTDHGVKSTLMEAIESGDLRKQISVTAGQVAPWKRTGIAVKSNLPFGMRSRALELVPETRVKLDDGRAVLDQADRWAAAMKLAPEQRDALHDALTKVRDTPDHLGDNPLADRTRILAHRRLAMSERRNAVVDALRQGADRYMEPYAKWKAIADDGTRDAATRMAARERVDKAQSFIDEVLQLGGKLEDAETAYWRDAAKTNRSFFGAIVQGRADAARLLDGADAAAAGLPWQMTRAEWDATAERLYHGTSRQFAKFADDASTFRSNIGTPGGGHRDPSYYFTGSAEVANRFAMEQRSSGVSWLDPLGMSNAGITPADARAGFERAFDAGRPVGEMVNGQWKPLTRRAFDELGDELFDPERQFGHMNGRPDAFPRVVVADVRGRTLDLTGNVESFPESLRAVLKADGIDGDVLSWVDHQRSPGLVRWMKENGYTKALVRDDVANTGGRSVLVLPDAANGLDHRSVVQAALESGKIPPRAVLADYPDLVAQYGLTDATEVLQPARMSPTLIAEHVGDTMAMPNPRDVREAFNSPLVKAVMKTPGATFTKHTLEFAMDKVLKPSHLLRLAFPVRVIGDEQARIFAEGGDSIYAHPIRAIAWALGDSKFKDLLPDSVQLGRSDVRGRIFDRADDWARGLNKSDQAFWQDVHYKRLESWAPFRYGQSGFDDAWHEAIGRIHLDPVGQLILNAENLDEAKRVWWENLGDVRARLAESHPPSMSNPMARSGADLLTEEGAAAYIDDVAERLQHVTQGDPRLLEAVRTGKLTSTDADVVALAREGGGEVRIIDGVPTATVEMYLDKGTPNPVFTKALAADFDDVAANAFTNREIVGRRIGAVKDAEHVYDRAVTKAFSLFLGKPDDFLARSPYARQSYWDEVRTRVAYLHPDHVDELVRNAEAARLPRDQLRTIKRMAGKAGRTGDDALTMEELHHLGVAQAIDRTQDLLYDLSKRHQLADMAKLIAPFGEAWAEVIKVWTRQLAQPARWAPLSETARGLRSVEAGALINPGDASYDTETGEMRQRGLFYRDENGNEMLTFPLTRQMMGMVGLPHVPMVGRVQGLSVGFDVMPGLGPVAQIPMAGLSETFDDPKYDGIRDLLFPYGQPRGGLTKQVTDAATPAWLQKVINSGVMPLTDQGDYDQRTWSSTVIDNMRYLAATGNYAVSGQGASEDEIRRIIEDSKTNAGWMTFLRGLGQFTAPTAPTYEWAIEDKSGKRISALTLSRELHELQQDPDPEKRDRAVLIFLERHGAGAFAMLQGKTISVSPAGGLPPTERAAKWLASNEFARDEYGLSYGLFAPRAEDDKIDSNLYWRLVEGGERAQIDPEVALRLANRKVAQAAYYAVRNQAPANLTAEQSVALYEFRQELEVRYPGYSANGDPVPGTPVKASTEQVIADLQRAVADERLADNPLTKPLQAYFTLRSRAEALSTEATGRAESWTRSADAAGIRQGMFTLGSELASRYPEFKAAWESVLLNEFDQALVNDGRGN